MLKIPTDLLRTLVAVANLRRDLRQWTHLSPGSAVSLRFIVGSGSGDRILSTHCAGGIDSTNLASRGLHRCSWRQYGQYAVLKALVSIRKVTSSNWMPVENSLPVAEHEISSTPMFKNPYWQLAGTFQEGPSASDSACRLARRDGGSYSRSRMARILVPSS
jgi:hypothetical protein